MLPRTKIGVILLESWIRIAATIGSLVLVSLLFFIEPFVLGIPEDPALALYTRIATFCFSILFFIFCVGSFFLAPWLTERKLTLIPLSRRYPQIENLIQKLSRIEGLENPPKSYLDKSAKPRCYVFGRTQRNAKLVITEGLVKLLTEEELKALLLHELSHIRNKDMAFITWGVVFIKPLKYWFLALFTIVYVIQVLLFRRFLSNFLFASIFFFLFLFVIPTLAFNSVSRVRELTADARASLFLENQQTLISSFVKTMRENYMISIIENLKEKRTFTSCSKNLKWLGKLARFTVMTHPPLSERIRSLAEKRYLAKADKLRLFGKETSVYAGLIAFYFLIVISFINFLGVKVLTISSFFIIPLPIIIFLNNFEFKYIDRSKLFAGHVTKEYMMWLLKVLSQLITRNLISSITFFVASLSLIVSSVMWENSITIFVYGMFIVCFLFFLISSAFTVIILLVLLILHLAKSKMKKFQL